MYIVLSSISFGARHHPSLSPISIDRETREKRKEKKERDKTTWSSTNNIHTVPYWTNKYIEQAKKSALIIHRLLSPGRFYVPVRMM